MPIVRIEVTPPGITAEQKRTLIKSITELLQVVLHKDPKLTHVVITEISSDNWGIEGKSATQYLKND